MRLDISAIRQWASVSVKVGLILVLALGLGMLAGLLLYCIAPVLGWH